MAQLLRRSFVPNAISLGLIGAGMVYFGGGLIQLVAPDLIPRTLPRRICLSLRGRSVFMPLPVDKSPGLALPKNVDSPEPLLPRARFLKENQETAPYNRPQSDLPNARNQDPLCKM